MKLMYERSTLRFLGRANILKLGCSEVHFVTLSNEIEHRKVVKKLFF